MAEFKLVSLTRAKDGQEAAFTQWYSDVHVPEVLALPGVKNVKLSRLGSRLGLVPWQQMAVFEVEGEHPDELIPDIQRRLGSGEMALSEAIEMQSVALFITD